MEHKIYHIDSFTDSPFQGNPTVTVFNAEALSAVQMQAIAKEMNLSETGFILPSQTADYRFRFFTRDGSEIDFCGHATVGGLSAIREEFGKTGSISIETNAGVLLCEIAQENVTFEVPDVSFIPVELTHDIFENTMNIPTGILDRSIPILQNKNDRMVYFFINSMDDLANLSPSMSEIENLQKKCNFHVFCFATTDTDLDAMSRAFVPYVGVPEDPFTGSMQNGLISYLKETGQIDKTKGSYSIGQGDFLGRKGRATITYSAESKAKLAAKAHILFSAKLYIHEE